MEIKRDNEKMLSETNIKMGVNIGNQKKSKGCCTALLKLKYVQN